MKASDARILNILLLFLSLVILVLPVRNMYSENISLKSTRDSNKSQLQSLNDGLNSIKQQKADFDANEKKYEKYNRKLIENEIIDYFYGEAAKTSNGFNISSLSINEGSKNDIGLNEGSINVSAKFNSEDDMKKMITEIINTNNYKFFMDNFSYSYGESFTNEGIPVELQIKVLYK